MTVFSALYSQVNESKFFFYNSERAGDILMANYYKA